MSYPEHLPCGHPTADSLFDAEGGDQTLVTNPGQSDSTGITLFGPIVWCTTDGWVDLTVAQYEQLAGGPA